MLLAMWGQKEIQVWNRGGASSEKKNKKKCVTMMIQHEQYINRRRALLVVSFICYTGNNPVTFYIDNVLALHQPCSYYEPGARWEYKEQQKEVVLWCAVSTIYSHFSELLFGFKHQLSLSFYRSYQSLWTMLTFYLYW